MEGSGTTSTPSNRNRIPSENDEAFHRHDADTREMLDFLDLGDDDGDAGGASGGVSPGGGGGGVDEIFGELEAAKEGVDDGPQSSMGAGGTSSPSKPSRLSVRGMPAPASFTVSPSTSPSTGPTGVRGAGSDGSSGGHAAVPPKESSFDDLDDDAAAEAETAAASPSADSTAEGVGAHRPTIVALPPALSPLDGETSADRTSALLRSSSDLQAGPVTGEEGDDGTTDGAEVKAPASPPPPPTFHNLAEAVRSPLSTLTQLRDLCVSNSGGFYDVSDEDRPHLWCKAACHGQILEDVAKSSLADLFLEWDKTFQNGEEENGNDEGDQVGGEKEEEEKNDEGIETGGDRIVTRVYEESVALAPWVVRSRPDAGKGQDEAEAEMARSLRSLLLFYYHSNYPNADANANKPVEDKDNSDSIVDEVKKIKENVEKEKGAEAKRVACEKAERAKTSENEPVKWDPLLGPITAVLLSSGMTPAETSVVLPNLMPVLLPLMRFDQDERTEAARSLHGRFYLLSCYHLPLLVLHLDRYAPGWHWPRRYSPGPIGMGAANGDSDDAGRKVQDDLSQTKKSRDLQSQGTIPASWFVSHLAGGSVGGDGADGAEPMLDPCRLRWLWDILLMCDDGSLKFFLALAILERHADSLLMLTGDNLVEELERVMSLRSDGFVDVEGENGAAEPALGADGDNVDNIMNRHRTEVRAWYDRALSLSDSTPSSVVIDLRGAEDESVRAALNQRRHMTEERAQARMDEQARKHREMLEAERKKRDEEARVALVRARLVVFYKKFNPEKVNTVDTILEMYKGKIDLMDSRLKDKYGEGFLPKIPVINPRLSDQANKLLSNMNRGLQIKKQQIVEARKERTAKKNVYKDSTSFHLGDRVTVHVSASEILPTICGGHSALVEAEQKSWGLHNSSRSDAPLHFYLVDSRPDETVKEQGRFPTSATLSPEALMDPDHMHQQVEVFESLRGAVHICIMVSWGNASLIS